MAPLLAPDGGDLVVSGVGKSFGATRVLDAVDLRVPAGKTVALLGPSGCGKTTLLRLIAGLETADAGTIRIGDRTLDSPGLHVPPERRRVGMVFQDWALFPHLDVAGNIGYGLGESERGRVEEILEMVGLEGMGARMPSTLSGGQQQRVALARAIAPAPSVVLLDEPFSNLDAELRSRVRTEVRRLLADLAVTTLFVTHDQEEAFVVGDEVAVMRGGSIRQQAEPAALYAEPIDAWVAAFVGEANLIPALAHDGAAVTVIGPVPVDRSLVGECRVLVRPEQLILDPGGDAEVTGVEFYGHDCAYRVVKSGNELLVRAMASPVFRRGDRVRLRYEGPPAVAFPEERAPSRLPA